MMLPLSAKQSFGIWYAYSIGWVQKGGFLLILIHCTILSSTSSSAVAHMSIAQRTEETITKKGIGSEIINRRRRRRRLRPGTECTLYMRETQYAGHSHSHSNSQSVLEDKERTWMCEVQMEGFEEDTTEPSAQLGNTNNFNNNLKRLRYPSRNNYKGGASSKISTERATSFPSPMILVEIQGLGEEFFDMHNVKSGLTIMKISEGHLEEDDEEKGDKTISEDRKRNTFVPMSDKGSKVTDSTIDSRKDRNLPTIFTKLIVSPEAVVDLMDLSHIHEGAIGDENKEVEVHSGNIFQRESLGTTRQLQQNKRKRRKYKAIGELTTLIVRVIAPNGAEPTNNITDTQKKAFFDPVCLKSQYAACSKNQTIIKPFEGTTTTDVKIAKGVVDIVVDINPTGPSDRHPKKISNKNAFVNRAERMTEEKLGPLADQFDLVLFCIPPGTGDNWKAFANVNRYDSYYNDEWCGHVSAQLHEVGTYSVGFDLTHFTSKTLCYLPVQLKHTLSIAYPL